MSATTCETCRFWQGNGECRRMPPIQMETSQQPVYTSGMGMIEFRYVTRAIWPKVEANDWCGEHMDKATGANVGVVVGEHTPKGDG